MNFIKDGGFILLLCVAMFIGGITVRGDFDHAKMRGNWLSNSNIANAYFRAGAAAGQHERLLHPYGDSKELTESAVVFWRTIDRDPLLSTDYK